MNKVKLTLVGLDGNAFNLICKFRLAARHQGWGRDEIQAVVEDATSSDYGHLVGVLESNCESPGKEADDE